MDGIHDLGGKPGYGFVDQTSKAHPFEAPWEGRVFAMLNLVARAGAYRNTDEFRHAIERIAEDHYFDHGYFGRWLSAMELLYSSQVWCLQTNLMTCHCDQAQTIGSSPNR